MVKQPYRGGVGWDMKEFPESDLHVYGRDDTKIVVYNIRRYTKRGGGSRNFYKKPVNSCNFVDK